MIDKETVVALAYDMGTLKRVTKEYAYILDLRYETRHDYGCDCRLCVVVDAALTTQEADSED